MQCMKNAWKVWKGMKWMKNARKCKKMHNFARSSAKHKKPFQKYEGYWLNYKGRNVFRPAWLPPFPEICRELVYLWNTRILTGVKIRVTHALQKTVLKSTCQVVRMTTSENIISDDLGTTWYHQTKVPRGVQRKCTFLDLSHGLTVKIWLATRLLHRTVDIPHRYIQYVS